MENSIGYILNGYSKKIEQIDYFAYLSEYGNSQCDNPSEIETENENDDDEPTLYYVVTRYSHDRRKIRSKSHAHETEESALEGFYKGCEWYISEKNWDAPRFHDTKEEAIQDFANGREKPFEVCERYFDWKENYLQRLAEKQKQSEIQRKRENEETNAKVHLEVSGMTPDTQLILETFENRKLKSAAKSEAIKNSFASFLKRSGCAVSDFWKAWRLLSVKIDTITATRFDKEGFAIKWTADKTI